MSSQIVTLEAGSTLSLPSEAITALGLRKGSRLSLTVTDGHILLQPLLADDLNELCGYFAANPGLTDDILEDRRRDEEDAKRKFEC